jgi:hypothetical protein
MLGAASRNERMGFDRKQQSEARPQKNITIAKTIVPSQPDTFMTCTHYSGKK